MKYNPHQMITNFEEIHQIKSESPVIQYLIDYGQPSQIQQLNQSLSKYQLQDHVLNQFSKMIKHNQKQLPKIKNQLTFISYKKKKPVLQNKKHIYLTPIKNNTHKSYQPKRIKTMPSELTILKEQLLTLPCLKTKKKNNELDYQSIERKINNQQQSHFNDSNYQSEVIFKKKGSRKMSKHYNSNSNHSGYLSRIIDRKSLSKQSKIQIVQSIIENEEKKINNAEIKFDKFMNYQNPPSETLQRFIDRIDNFQKIQEKKLQKQVIKSEKIQNRTKFNLLMQYQKNLHKKNIKQLANIKKKFKMELYKMNEQKKAKFLSNQEGVQRILNPPITIERQNQLKKEGLQFQCKICNKK